MTPFRYHYSWRASAASLPTLLLALLFLACRHQDNPPDGNTATPATPATSSKMAVAVATSSPGADTAMKNSGRTAPSPDTSTFFPLLKGSYWIYETYRDGFHDTKSRSVDSVFEISPTDSGDLVDLTRQLDESQQVVTAQYRVDSAGTVWATYGSSAGFYPFSNLRPKPGQVIGDHVVRGCSVPAEADSDCVELEPTRPPGKQDPGKPNQNPTRFTFLKGVGMIRKSESKERLELVEYRIGAQGPVHLTVFSSEAAEAMAFISKIYADFHPDNTDFDHLQEGADTIFSPTLRDLIHQDAKQADGEVGYLDGDPICDCQDYDISDVRADFSRTEKGPPADDTLKHGALKHGALRADVRFKNFGNTTQVGLSLIHTDSGWRIADIQTESTPSLVGALRHAVNNPKNYQAR